MHSLTRTILAWSGWLIILTVLLPARADDLLEASLIFESNGHEGEVEAVLSVESIKRISKLTVFDPEHRPIFRLDVGNGGPGFSEIESETSEFSMAGGDHALPAGTYVVQARTVNNEWLSTDVELSHALLPAATLTAVTQNTDSKNTVLEWSSVNGVQAYRIEIEQETLRFELEVKVPGDITRLELPTDLLQPGEEYEIEISVEADNGNITVSESMFTAPG